MGKEYFLCGLPAEVVTSLNDHLITTMGEPDSREALRDEVSYPFVGLAKSWINLSSPLCVSIYEETGALHATQVENNTKLDQLLEELASLYSCS